MLKDDRKKLEFFKFYLFKFSYIVLILLERIKGREKYNFRRVRFKIDGKRVRKELFS